MSRRSAFARFLVAAAFAWLLVLPASAAAFPLAGPCTLALTSTDATGRPLGTATSGDASASPADPLPMDWDGAIAWEGRATTSFRDNHYHVAIFGMATPFQDGSANADDVRATSGELRLTADLQIGRAHV